MTEELEVFNRFMGIPEEFEFVGMEEEVEVSEVEE